MDPNQNQNEGSEQRTIRTSEVKAMLQQGKTREEIKDYYGLSANELKTLFMVASLKGVRTQKARRVSFLLEDDIPAGEADNSEDTDDAPEDDTVAADPAPTRGRRSRGPAIPNDQANVAAQDVSVAEQSATQDAETEQTEEAAPAEEVANSDSDSGWNTEAEAEPSAADIDSANVTEVEETPAEEDDIPPFDR